MRRELANQKRPQKPKQRGFHATLGIRAFEHERMRLRVLCARVVSERALHILAPIAMENFAHHPSKHIHLNTELKPHTPVASLCYKEHAVFGKRPTCKWTVTEPATDPKWCVYVCTFVLYVSLKLMTIARSGAPARMTSVMRRYL